MVNLIQETLGIPVVLMGFGLPDDRIHGPNEKLHLPTFFKGIETSIRFMAEVGAWQAVPKKGSTTNNHVARGGRHDHRLPLPRR